MARRFRVPPTMVEQAKRRRLDDDWLGAWAAARFEVGGPLDRLAEFAEQDAAVAERLRTALGVDQDAR